MHLVKMIRPPGIFWKPKWRENGAQKAKCTTEGEVWAQNYTYASKLPKHRSLDDEATECRWCKTLVAC